MWANHLTIGVGRTTRRVEVVGVVSAAGLDLAIQLFGIQNQYMEYAVSAMFVDYDWLATTFRKTDATLLQVNLDDTVTDADARKAVMAAAPGVEFRGHRWITETVSDLAQTLLRVQTTVALAALLLATVAVGSVIAATAQSRRFECGVLRAVGAAPSVLVRLILAEAFVVAVTAAVIGTALGLQAAWVDIRHMRSLAGLPVNLGVPLGAIAGGFAIVATLAALAALPVAWRLARQSPRELVALGRNE